MERREAPEAAHRGSAAAVEHEISSRLRLNALSVAPWETNVSVTPAERLVLEVLGYTEQWLDSGLLDRQLLADQHEQLQADKAKKTGPYRARALRAWREAQQTISESQLDAFLSVVASDPDTKMAQSAVAELIQSPQISLAQLDRIAGSDPKLMRRHEKLIRRTYLLRRLDDEITDEFFEVVMATQDAGLHSVLIRDSRLARKHAQLLAKRGANATIREKAQAWVLDKKHWK